MGTNTKDIKKQSLIENEVKYLPFSEEFNVLKNIEYPERIDITDRIMEKIYERVGRKKTRFINRTVITSLLAACFVGIIVMTATRMRANNDQIINEFLTQVYFQDYLQQTSFDEEFLFDIDFE